MDALIGRARTRGALGTLLPRELVLVPFSMVDLFGNDLDRYAELISGPDDRVAGFMTRGEGLVFAQRVRLALHDLGFGAAAVDRFTELATWFEHKRMFVKLEWHRTDTGLEPLAACYFRRRPSVTSAIGRLRELGAGEHVAQAIETLAAALEKSTIHFVSAAFRPGQPPHQKLYFSQLVEGPNRATITRRLERVFDQFEISGALREVWRLLHDVTVGPGEQTYFVSTSFVGDRLAASFKIDYPDVSAVRASAWRPTAEPQIQREVQGACERAGVRVLSYLGVRFARDADGPALKYYADVAAP